jgi:hypothetical protein
LKTISFLLIAMTMAFLVSQAGAAEWVSLGKDGPGNECFYDQQTLTKLPNGIIRVWIMNVYSDEARKKYIQRRISDGLADDKRYETLSYSLSMWEINCAAREYRGMANIDYSTDRGKLETNTYEHQPLEGWRPVPPESIGEVMYKAICPPQKKK